MRRGVSSVVARRGGTGAREQPLPYFWKNSEIALLRRMYAAEIPIEIMVGALPGRSVAAIEQKAASLGVAVRKRRAKADAEDQRRLDAQILKVYASRTRGSVNALAKSLSMPACSISRRAAQLGVAKVRLKEAIWTDRELAILRDSRDAGPEATQRALREAGFYRGAGAVMLQVKAMMIRQTDGWSAKELCALMGVREDTVVRWIASAGLKADRPATGWRVKRPTLRAWVLSHPLMVDLRRVQQDWFIDLLASRSS